MSSKTSKQTKSRFEDLSAIAHVYGERSFQNYAQIRSIAEAVRDGLCAYMQAESKCVFLVPPQGEFVADNYGSGAFSVSGKGFLPLEPISFGLGIRVSESGDFMRIVLHCRKEGERIYLRIEENTTYDINLPFEAKQLEPAIEGLYQHLLRWFSDRIERFDHGNYGVTDIGFDILRVDEGPDA